MEFQITFYSLIYLLAGMVTLIPVWFSWRMRKFPGVYSLFLMMLFISLWAFLCMLEMTLVGVETKRIIVILEDASFLTFNGMLCLFILDYFSIGHWLTPAIRRWMWSIPGVLLLLDMTDSWHNLVWKSYSPGPPGSNLLMLSPGPLFYGITILLYSMDLMLLIIVGYFATRKSSKKRTQTRFIFAGILSSWLSQLLFVITPDQALGLSILPIGFAVCGMLISWVVFEDLLGQSQSLAKDLQASRDDLSERLDDQRQKISGMFDLVYLNASLKAPDNLVKEALEKMRQITGCDSAAFFIQMENQYILDVEAGMSGSQKQPLATWAVPAASGEALVVIWPDAPRKRGLPAELLRAGFQSAAIKSISLSTGQQGSIFYLWQAPHPFRVDEIALMAAQGDVLGMIIENDQSRRLSQEWAILEERQHLGRELHDRISQDLFSLSIFGASSIRHAAAGLSAALADDLNAINTLAQQALNEMRLLLFELQPYSQTNDLPLEEAIQKRFAIVESHVNIQTSLIVSGCEALPTPIARVLFGVVVEALNNTVKYARAKTVSILIQAKDQKVCLEIRDDGGGFNLHALGRRGLGLENMRQRVTQINGTLQITSEIGRGTFIAAVIPMSNKTAAGLSVSETNPIKRGCL